MVPPAMPRTKPKALAYALPMCGGEFVVDLRRGGPAASRSTCSRRGRAFAARGARTRVPSGAA